MEKLAAKSDNHYKMRPQTRKNQTMKKITLAILSAFLFAQISALALPGQVDPAFINTNLQVGLGSLMALPDGRVVVGFNNASPIFNGTNVGAVLQLNMDGTLDGSFAASDTNKYTIYGTARLTGGNLLVAGSFTSWAGTARKTLVKLDATGAVRAGFFSGVTALAKVYTVEQPDGKILVASSSTSLIATNGTALPPMERLLANGTLDTNFFTTNIIFACYGLDVVPDGSGRYFLNYLSLTTFKYDLARFNADGSYDTNFTVVTLDSSVTAIKALANGGVVASGGFTTYTNRFGQANVPHLVRINPDGSRDASFNFTDGRSPLTFALQADGKVILPNTTTFVGDDRFNQDGSPDGSWTHNATTLSTFLITIDSSDRVLCGGFSVNTVYRLQNDSSFGAIAPFFTSAPANANVYPGDSTNFTLNAGGPGPLTYQWQFNSNNITGATNTILNLANCQSTNGGFYRLVASNANGSTASTNALLTLRADARITQNPQPVSADASDTTNFSVAYASLYPVSFQWLFNNVAIPGATNNPLVIAPVYTTNAGNYSVIVSNQFGGMTSAAALLTVNSTLRFKSQPPTNVFVPLGSATNLSAVVAGNPPLSFQWYLNGAAVAGANSSSFPFNSFSRTNVGAYALVATNLSGAITSQVAKVTFAFATPVNSWIFTNAIPITLSNVLSFGNAIVDMKADGPLGVALIGTLGACRFDDDGSVRWVAAFTPATNVGVISVGLSCAVDGLGNTYATAEFQRTLSIGGLSVTNPGVHSGNNTDARGMMLVKLDITGQAVWMRYIDGGLDFPKLAIDGSGGVIISGAHNSVVNFGNGGSQAAPLGNAGVVARYAADGTFSWLRNYRDVVNAGFGLVEIDAVVAQGTNIWVSGLFNDSITFGSFVGTDTAPGHAYYSWYGRLNNSGTELWFQSTPGGAQFGGLAVGDDQVLWAADGYLERFAPNGTPLTFISGVGGTCINVDSNNLGVINGIFNFTTTIGTNSFFQPNTFTNNLYTGRYNTNGGGLGAVVNGTSYSAYGQCFRLLAGNRRGDAYVAGVPPVHLGTTTDLTGTNFFLAKFNAPVLAPTIVAQPNAAYTNQSLSFFQIGVTVYGQGPLSYQWRNNGVPLLNQTNSTLTFPSPLPPDGGTLDCVISNALGVATTLPSQVTIIPPFTVFRQPGSAEIILGTNIIGGSNILPAYLQPSAMVGHTFNFFITNGSGVWPMTANFTMNFPSASAYNIPSGTLGTHAGTWFNQFNYPNGGIGFSLQYWTTSPSNIQSSINMFPDGGFDIHHDISDTAGCCAVGYYTIGASANSNATFTVTTTGSVIPTIQWYRNGILLPGQTNTSLTYTPAGYPQAGTYTATMTYSNYVATTAPATLNLYPPAVGYTYVPGNATMDFTIPPGYILQSTATLAPPNWTTISTNSTYTVPLNMPGMYFRIVP